MNLHDAHITLAALVTERPELAPVLDDLGLDFCCGGQRSLLEAIAAAGLDRGATVAKLDQTPAAPRGDSDWSQLDMAELVDHVESTHHVYLAGAFARLDALAEKVAGVHGERHPELADVHATYRALRADLEPHLMKEEQILFPMIRELATATRSPSFHCGTLSNPISVMTSEHDRAGELLARLRALTDGYLVPADGCASYQLLYSGLAELEADTHLHVHKENNLLFPAAVEAERRLAGAG